MCFKKNVLASRDKSSFLISDIFSSWVLVVRWANILYKSASQRSVAFLDH